jgi:hypothetical protein
VEPDMMAFAKQWLDKHVPAAINTHETIEEFWDVLFSMWSILYQRKEDD